MCKWENQRKFLDIFKWEVHCEVPEFIEYGSYMFHYSIFQDLKGTLIQSFYSDLYTCKNKCPQHNRPLKELRLWLKDKEGDKEDRNSWFIRDSAILYWKFVGTKLIYYYVRANYGWFWFFLNCTNLFVVVVLVRLSGSACADLCCSVG